MKHVMGPRSNNKKMNADVVIIGGGGAGLSAAIAAAEQGTKSIVILEKRAVLGGNTALATGLLACESPVQTRERIVADRDELFKKALKWAHLDRINPRIIRAFINKSGDTIRWLEDMGLEFNIVMFYPNQHPRIWHCPKGKGAELTKALADRCQALGVKMALRCSGKLILRGKNGNIMGLEAEKDGETFEIAARSVVITTGGFGANKKLLKDYCPSFYDGLVSRGLDLMGDGLSMAANVGAAIDDYVTLLKEGPRLHPNAWPLMGLEREPITIWVNREGRRFVDETSGEYPFESVNAVLMQPDNVCYSILDSDIKKNYEEIKSELEIGIQKELNKNNIKISDSWDEIAQWIGTDPDVMNRTIEEYNSFCDRGYDVDFSKDRRYLVPIRTAPFYAIRCMPVYLDTLGGIKINERMEVMDALGKPIQSLYAAGVITSGWMGENYCSELSGSAFSYAINSGRIAGENVARFVAGL